MQQPPLCPLSHGYWRIAEGKIVNATFWLRMLEQSAPPANELTLRRVVAENSPSIRAAFNRIGTDSLWDRATELNRRPSVNPWAPQDQLYFAFGDQERQVGLVELHAHRCEGAHDTEISYLGVFPEVAGRGLGRRLLMTTLHLAWTIKPRSVFLHTCNTDHQGALPLYLSCGFTPYLAGLQVTDDPRREGLLPPTAAAHVPLIEA